MRTRKTPIPVVKKPAPVVKTSEAIEAEIAAFLSSGGEIQQIARGVSSNPQPSRHITIGKK